MFKYELVMFELIEDNYNFFVIVFYIGMNLLYLKL